MQLSSGERRGFREDWRGAKENAAAADKASRRGLRAMRIQDRDMQGAGAAEAGRAQETRQSERSGVSAGSRAGGSGGDRVELSAGLGQLARAVSTHAAERGTRVEQLAAEYRIGRYQANPSEISRAMISEALNQRSS